MKALESLVASILGFAAFAPSAAAMVPGAEVDESAASVGSVAPSRTLVRIEVDPSIEDADLLRTRIEEDLDISSTRVPTFEGYEQWIAVRISGVKYDYRVATVAMRDDEPVGTVGEAVACVCSSAELSALVDAGIAAAAEALRQPPGRRLGPRPVEPEPERQLGEETRPVQPSSPRPPVTARDAPRRRRMGQLGHSGIGVGILGAATLGAGLALVLRPDEISGPPGTGRGVSTRTPGLAMTIGGSTALATGVVLIAIDRARGRERSTSFAPAFGARQVSLTITRRF